MASSSSPNQLSFFDPQEGYEKGVAVDVEERARSLLMAVNALDRVAKRRGLEKAVDLIPGKKEELAKEYASRKPVDGKPANTETTFEEVVLPGASKTAQEGLENANRLFDDAFGDYKLAKEKALQELTPEERAELELQYPEQEEFQAAFRARMLDSGKVGDPYRIKNRPTKGSINRKKVQENMSKTLHRVEKARRSDQEAA
jgi:hypothetical protein